VSDVPSETLAGTFALRARLALDQGKARAALPLAERALALFERGEPRVHELAEARLLLAGLLRASGRDRDRARSLAEQAREAFTKAHDVRLAGEASALVTNLQ
jgi:hypothetical protein